MRALEYILYGAVTFLLGWFSPRIFVKQQWSSVRKSIFGAVLTFLMFAFLGIYRLSTGVEFESKVQEFIICPIFSFQHCPSNTVHETSRRRSAANSSAAPVISSGEIWLDESLSVDEGDRSHAAQDILRRLPALTDKLGLKSWSIYGFSENPWDAVPFYQAENLEGELARARSFRMIAEAIKSRGPQPSRCTNIIDLLLRVSQSSASKLVFIISDGQESCSRKKAPVMSSPPGKVFFVLTGQSSQAHSGTETQADSFAKGRLNLAHIAPWISVVPPWKLPDALEGIASIDAGSK
jgi:hypothetical protein